MPSVVDTPMLPLPFFPLPHQIQTVSVVVVVVVVEQALPLDEYTNPMDFIPRAMIENYKRNMDM
jgi:hypothetical protein